VVAEQVAETPVLEANAEVPANPVVETPAESTEEVGPDYEALISTLDADEDPAGDVDAKPVATGVPDTSVKVETAEEAAERGRREAEEQAEQKARKQQTDAQYQSYIQGLNGVTQDVPLKVSALMDELSNRYATPADLTRLMTEFNRLNGALKPLYDHQLEQNRPAIYSEAETMVRQAVVQELFTGFKDQIGEDGIKNVQTAAPKTWPELGQAVAKEARNGYVSQEAAKKAEAAHLKKLDAALASRAREGHVTRSLADLSGTPRANLPANMSGGGGKLGTTEALDRAYGNSEIDAATYRERYKALTGREP
jgi:hypothetical protein